MADDNSKFNKKLARWSLLLQEYDFHVEHRAGTANTNADCLSRYPLESTEDAPELDQTKGEVLAPANLSSTHGGDSRLNNVGGGRKGHLA